jgi:hypothetical protein
VIGRDRGMGRFVAGAEWGHGLARMLCRPALFVKAPLSLLYGRITTGLVLTTTMPLIGGRITSR